MINVVMKKSSPSRANRSAKAKKAEAHPSQSSRNEIGLPLIEIPPIGTGFLSEKILTPSAPPLYRRIIE
jgi:hypothetical protein